MKKLRIAQFIDTHSIGGAETMMLRLSLALINSGNNVIILHFGNPHIEEFCALNNIESSVVPHKKYYKSIKTIYLFSLLFSRHIKKLDIDIIHTHLYGPATGVSLGAFIYNIPHIATIHDVYTVKERAGRGINLMLTQFFGTSLITVSKDMQHFYEKHIPFSKDINCIYNGFNLTKSPDKNFDFIDKNALTLITVGRIIPLKRQIHQLKVLANYIRDNNIQMIFVGDGEDLMKLNNTIIELSLTDKVIALGERDDVEELLAASDVFILSSESEGLSCSIIEAMSSGLACVVSNVGGNKELIQHGVNGYIFELDDDDSLINQVDLMYKNKSQRINMGKSGKNIADKIFSIENMQAQYITAYNKLLKI